MHRNTMIPLNWMMGVIVFLFFSDSVFSQSDKLPASFDSLVRAGNAMMYQDFEKADQFLTKAETIILSRGADQHPIPWINLLQSRAMTFYYNFKFAEAKEYLDKSFSAIRLSKRLHREQSDSLAMESKFMLALYYQDLAQYDDALSYLDSVELYVKRNGHGTSQCLRLFQVAQYQASTYQLKGEYESAINQYLASIPYYDCYRDKTTSPNYALTYRNIGRAYLLMDNYDQARFYLENAKRNLDSCWIDPAFSLKVDPNKYRIVRIHAIVLYNFMAEFFHKKQDLASAKFYYRKSVQLGEEIGRNNFVPYRGLAKIAVDEGKVDEAISQLRKALEALGTHGLGFETASVYRDLSIVYEKQGNYSQASLMMQKALNSLQRSGEPDISNKTSNPPVRAIAFKKEAISALREKSSLLLKKYRRQNSESDLNQSYETIQLAIQLLDSTRDNFSLEKDKVVFGEVSVPVYELSLRIALELYHKSNDRQYLNDFLRYMEKSKSAVLLDHLKLVKRFSGIPREVEEKERQLKVELSIREKELYEKEGRQEETAGARVEIDALKKRYAALNAEIKTKYPNYYSLKIESRVLSLDEAQKFLRPDQALVEYFIGDSTLFSICISPNHSRIYVTPLDSLQEKIMLQRSLLTEPRNFLKRQRDLQRCSAEIGEMIAPWINDAELSPISSLTIVPHGILNYVPFEIVRAGATQTYLMDRFSISYALSASLLSQQRITQANHKVMAGFNADYAQQSGLAELQGSVAEIDEIVDLFGNSRAYTHATADDFRSDASEFRILHLALHSIVNDEKPLFSRLIFTGPDSVMNNAITANELYSMELNSEMVVLSACETGIGLLHRGEGMMSLSRAFMYAGVPATVMSLWKVPDQASALLMTDFYKFIQQGFRKDVALAMAKKEFVKKNPEMAHPFFWAGFVVNGKTDPIQISPFTLGNLLPWIAGGIALIIVLILIKRRKNFFNSPKR